MKQYITEGLDHMDLEGHIEPTITIDEYAAHMGEDSEIVTLAFIVNSQAAGQDLADWFERGYDFVLDSEVSEGELSPGKWLVFVEMNRRSKVPERVIELISDLKTLTGLDVKEWTLKIDDEDYDAEENIMKSKLTLSPHEYRKEKENEEELNEIREAAGLQTKPIHRDQDEYIKRIKSMAGM
jgi:hypothetical protein